MQRYSFRHIFIFALSLYLFEPHGIVAPPLAFSQSEVYLGIKGGRLKRIPIAVDDFTSNGIWGQNRKVASTTLDVFKADLQSSGLFDLMDSSALKDSLSVQSGKIDRWKSLGARALISGNIKEDKDRVSIAVKLFDVSVGQLLSVEEYNVEEKDARWVGHQISDDIVYALTGEQGISRTLITFVSKRSGYKEIHIVDQDGYGERQVTLQRSIITSPCWSPDGSKIAYSLYDDGRENWDLYTLDLKSSVSLIVSKFRGLNIAPSWSHDGARIAFTMSREGNSDIYTVDPPDGGNLRRLTYKPGIDTSPVWSPDDKRIAFTSDRSGNPKIYVINADGTGARRLTWSADAYEDSANWSPRGNRIAFVSRGTYLFDIYISDIYGENVMRLTSNAGSNENPVWSPDGLRIAFSSTRSGKSEIYVMNWDGSDQRRITSGGGNYSPSWSPRL